MAIHCKKTPLSLFIALGLSTGAAVQAKSVIVELQAPPAAQRAFEAKQNGTAWDDNALQAYRDELSTAQNAFLQSLQARGIGHSLEGVDVPDFDGAKHAVQFRYTLVFNGMALNVADDKLGELASLPEVKRVHAVRSYQPKLDESVRYIRAPELYGQVHELSAFDDLREGFEGQGINVAIVDTGVDWSHDQFGGDASPPRFGLAPATAALNSNQKVNYYLPLADVAADMYGHGTHVAATAAGYLAYAPGKDGVPLTADDVPVHGVAPQAKIMGYQVCNGPASSSTVIGGCLNPSILLALEDAVSPRTLNGLAKPVAHVINLSLGGSGGPDDSTSIAASNASLMGAIVVAAAGNDGPGESTLGSPAAGRHVIAVAAHNDPGVYPNSADVLDAAGVTVLAGSQKIIATLAPDSNLKRDLSAPISARYVYAGLADTPDQVPVTVAGNICLVKRGSTATAADNGTGLFANKAANCQAKGAIATVVYNDQPGQLGAVLAPSVAPVFTISGTDGTYLKDQLGFGPTGLSRHPLRLNPQDASLFEGMAAGFSSRGPVEGLGQVKPDVAAPGVAILAATTATGVPVTSMADATRYTEANGTSMATPHVVGAAALIRQAHLDWTPDMVRASMINTATNSRTRNGVAKADGLNADNVITQGGGLIDVNAAVKAKALMGVSGDGIVNPGILASHSFGEVPVVNSRVTHSERVTVSLRDVSGSGGTYNLRVANNRDLQLSGISASTSKTSVTLPAGGTASFDAIATVNGDVVRKLIMDKGNGSSDALQMQWYVIAERSDGSQTLRMPFYLKPTLSVPAQVVASEQTTYSGTILVGDTGVGAADGVTYKDIPFEVSDAVFQLSATLEAEDDLDLFLLGPDGEELAASTNGGGPENVNVRINRSGTYVYRVSGWLAAATDYVLTSTLEVGGLPPQVAPITGDYVNDAGQAVDFNGKGNLRWTANGGELGFEVEHSADGVNYSVVKSLSASATSYNFNLPDGLHSFRVRALFPGKIGKFVSAASQPTSILVDHRVKKRITRDVSTAVSNVSLNNGVFQFDLSMTNNSDKDYVPLVNFKIVKINSGTGTVYVTNADNGGTGQRRSEAAVFDYSHRIGSDEVFSASETTGTRTLRFSDMASELFSFDAVVTGYQRTGNSNASNSGASSDPSPEPESDDLSDVTSLVRFTINPLTGTVVSQVIEGLIGG